MCIDKFIKLNDDQKRVILALAEEFPHGYNKVLSYGEWPWDQIITKNTFLFEYIELCKDIESWYNNQLVNHHTGYGEWKAGYDLNFMLKKVQNKLLINNKSNKDTYIKYKDFFHSCNV